MLTRFASFCRFHYHFVLLLFCLAVILVLTAVGGVSLPDNQQNKNRSVSIKPINSATLRQKFSRPLALAQAGDTELAWTKDRFLMIDIRSEADFDAQHIKGSLNIPIAQLHNAILGDDTNVVIYSPSTLDIKQATDILSKLTTRTVFTLSMPVDALVKQGYLLETTPKSATPEIPL